MNLGGESSFYPFLLGARRLGRYRRVQKSAVYAVGADHQGKTERRVRRSDAAFVDQCPHGGRAGAPPMMVPRRPARQARATSRSSPGRDARERYLVPPESHHLGGEHQGRQ